MKIPKRFLFAVFLLACTLVVSVVQGQGPEAPLVVLIEGRDIGTSSVTNVGPSGASRLQEIFRDLGARTQRITLNDEIPANADLAVLFGPLRRMRPAQIARLWGHVYRGGNLLIAVDPDNANVGTANVGHQVVSSGLAILLDRAYGVLIENTFVVTPNFTVDTVSDRARTYIPTYPDSVPHDILAPLVEYDLPVFTWGTRSLRVEPFGINGFATPLLYTPNVYGESETDVFTPYRNNLDFTPAPLEFTPEDDIPSDDLNTAALAQSIATGSRVLILSDAEMLQNGFGLRFNGDLPYNVGNYVFAQRAIAWLLEIDPQEWPSLPQGFTRIALDGDGGDWASNIAAAADQDPAPSPQSADLQQIRTFFDDQFLYLLLGVAQPASSDVGVRVQFDIDNDGQLDRTITIQQDLAQVVSSGEAPVDIPDLAIGYSTAIELRLPLRIIPPNQSIDRICLLLDGQEVDCTTQPVNIPLVSTRALTELPYTDGLLVLVESRQRINLRRTPDTFQPPLTTIATGTTLRALARNEAGDWVYVQNARYEGWLASFVLVPNGDLMTLPIVETP